MKNSLFKKMLLVTPLMLATLSGCGGSRGSIDTYDVDVTADTQGAKITMWTGFGSDMTDALNDLLVDFQQKTGITVSHEGKGGYDGLLNAINLSATKGSYPNIAVGYPDHFATYIKSNIILRLDGLIENDYKRGLAANGGYTQNGVQYGADGIKTMDYDDFYADYKLENESLEFKEDGTPYVLGVPFNKSTEVMVANKDFFDWAQTNKDFVKERTNNVEIKVPTTWDEVKEIGTAINTLLTPFFKVINDHGDEVSKGKILGSDNVAYDTTAACEDAGAKVVLNLTEVSADDFRPFTYDSQANLFITAVRQWGGQYTEVDVQQTGKGYIVFQEGSKDQGNKKLTIEALDFIQDLFDSNILGIPEKFNALYCSDAFKAYKSVMNVGSSAGLKNCANGAMKISINPIPTKDNDHRFVISQGTPLGLFNKGGNKERLAAWKLMCYLSQQANGLFAAKTGYFPSCDFALNSDEYQQWLEQTFYSAEDRAKIDAANINNNIYLTEWTKFVDPGFRGSADIRQQVNLVPGYLMVHQYADSDATIDAVVRKLREYVKNP